MARKMMAAKHSRNALSAGTRRKRAAALSYIPAFDTLEPRMLMSVAPIFTPTFVRHQPNLSPNASPAVVAAQVSPSQMRHAYGLDAISINGITGDGSGQTIAIIDAFKDPTLASDLATFDADFGLAAPPNLVQIRANGSLITTSNQPPVDNVDPVGNSWAVETSLDVEWAHVIAPKANILVVLADDSGNSLYNSVTTGATYNGTAGVAKASVVSMSWGGSDLGGTADSLFNVAGVTFFASSGDSGAYTGSSGASYPASSPNVVAVGGTSLYLSSGNYSTESAWSGGGGGLSTVEGEPAYQKAVVPSSITTTQRAIPDVSMDADPNTGVAVIDSYDIGSTSPIQVGGTSLAAPMFAATTAIANQERLANGKALLNATSPTNTLTSLYALASTDFHDVTTGSNGHAATAGYDLATGRGTPTTALVSDLVGPTAAPNPTIASVTANPTSILTTGSSTITANNVTDPGATITSVGIYRESNSTPGLQVGTGGDTLVANATQSGANWSTTVSGLAAGSYTYYALATDSASVTSATGTSAASATLTVTAPTPNPTIGSVTVSPSSIAAGTSVTVSANNVSDTGSTLTGVAIYQESNGTAGVQPGSDTLVGNATQSGSNWTLAVATTGFAPGNYTYYAVATDAASVTSPTGTSAPSAVLTVNAPNPLIGSLAFSPSSVIAGTATTITAANVTDAGASITGVAIYRESNSTTGLQIGSDTLVGAAVKNGSNWSLSISTTGMAVGAYTYYAVATDSATVSSAASSATLNIVTNTYTNLFTTDSNIGSPSPTGTSSFNSSTGVYTVTGGGSDIWGTSDKFNYDYASYSGNGSIVARVTAVSNANGWSKAGVMFRSSTAANSRFVDLTVTPSNGVAFQWRASTGGSSSNVNITGITAPAWVKLTRSGNTFTAFYSTSTTPPTSWTQIGTAQTISISTTALAGLAVTSHASGTLCTATFSNVQLGTSTLVVQAAASNGTPVILNLKSNSNGDDQPSASGPALGDAACVPPAAPAVTLGSSSDQGNPGNTWVASDASGDCSNDIAASFSNHVCVDATSVDLL
jgi:hypothetical protein